MLLTVTQKLLEGFGTSCIIFIVTLLAALPLGLVIAFGSMSRFKPIAWLTRGFVWIMRGTPLMLQLMIVYYGPGMFIAHYLHTSYLLRAKICKDMKNKIARQVLL